MAKCPHCGAEFKFDARRKLVHCDYCGSDFNPRELKSDSKMSKLQENIDGKCYRCTQCGATLMTFLDTAATFCSYCGSQNMVEDKMVFTAPEVVIPFSKSQDECIKNYKRKISSFLFSPSYMKSDLVVKKFRGIYMPYGIYTLTYQGVCVNKGEKYNHRSGDYVYYDDYNISAEVDATYDGISFDLASKYYDEYSLSIPFNFKEAVPYNSNYLAGFYADSKDVEIGTYSDEAIKLVSNDSTRYLRNSRLFSKYNCRNPKVPFHVGNKKVGFFPVYFLAIRDKDDKHVHYAVINGQTGKVAADMPINFFKYLIFSILLAVPIFFLLNGLPVVLPIVINLFSIIAAMIAIIISYHQINACNNKETHYEDKGFTSLNVDENGKRKKKKRKVKFRASHLLKYIFAMIISLIPIIFRPVMDIYYYVASVISLILILLSFYDLVKIHNRLVSNPIPQLDKRGGDENE